MAFLERLVMSLLDYEATKPQEELATSTANQGDLQLPGEYGIASRS